MPGTFDNPGHIRSSKFSRSVVKMRASIANKTENEIVKSIDYISQNYPRFKSSLMAEVQFVLDLFSSVSLIMMLLERFEHLPTVLKHKIMGYYPGPEPCFLKQLKRKWSLRCRMAECSNCRKFFQSYSLMECNGMSSYSGCDYPFETKFCNDCTCSILHATYEGPMCQSCCDAWYLENQY